ncbi:sulfate adenylyltransferase [Anaerosacchariphilus polymeriproducens]|uniref:Sulfate adenylyltransferase n=2 Tax=Anaerosacchariphilus polymeriproducens TaxID=1812858 RepID=A0A371ATG4_9FIRM|nr:sulfate adenylyltransferase [Anaerosacchariphilus polymeriproducens]
MHKYQIDEETLQDVINIETGILYPLRGFMGKEDYQSVVENYCLSDGEVFTLPITFDVVEEFYNKLESGSQIALIWEGRTAATLLVEDKFQITEEDLFKIFKTTDDKHPGVLKEKKRSRYRVGGLTKIVDMSFIENALNPVETERIFREKKWKTIVGFQTRNPIHKAHEHLQRIGLEICDGLFINPITGWKKKGDFTEEAVMAAYNKMIELFYPKDRVYLAGLKTQMRYAGPREAVFHAIIRRNLGCTHFIIGRDHAGVGNYYDAYDAHKLASQLEQRYNLGIELLLLHEPYYCKKCGQIVTDKNCSHYATDRVEISGTIIREYIAKGSIPNEIMLRDEIFNEILSVKQIFIGEKETQK